jgi:general stress protein YciG
MAMKYKALIVLWATLFMFAACSPSSIKTEEETKNEDETVLEEGDDDSQGSDDQQDDSDDDDENVFEGPGTEFVAGHSVALESVLRNIPEEFIQKARDNFVVSYQHTSHGTHVTRGVFGLPQYKSGDEELFAVTLNEPGDGMLNIYDNKIELFAPEGVEATDLSTNETAFVDATRNYLDDPRNEAVNVVMWSWCNIAGHNVEDNYLPGMQVLIQEYGEGGSKIGSEEGMRERPVHFIFMTGHANQNNNVGSGKPKNLAALINDFCEENQYYCLDYYSIDTHDMDGNYWEDAGDNGGSDEYGGNFYEDWQEAHEAGVHYWYNRYSPGGDVAYGAHNTQHITANRKGMAFWWILARLAGWNGELEE